MAAAFRHAARSVAMILAYCEKNWLFWVFSYMNVMMTTRNSNTEKTAPTTAHN